MTARHPMPNSSGAASSAAKIKDTCGYTPENPRAAIGGKGVPWTQTVREVKKAWDALCEKKPCYRQF